MHRDRCNSRWRTILPPTLLAVLLLVTLGIGTVSATVWQVETLDSNGDVGEGASLVLDAKGNPSISYVDTTNNWVKLARHSALAWRVARVPVWPAPPIGRSTSLALDKKGNRRISLSTNGDLGFISSSGGWFSFNDVDTTGDAGPDTSLALDSKDRPCIAYWDTITRDVKYAVPDAGVSWKITTVTEDTPQRRGDGGVSLALDRFGWPRISYYNDTFEDLDYAAFDGKTWRIVTAVSTGIVDTSGTSLALDKSGRPRISYIARGFSPEDPRTVMLASFDGTAWKTEVVDSSRNARGATSLALDSKGNPRITYFDSATGSLMYAARTGTAWTAEPVAPAGSNSGGTASLKLARDGAPRIAFYDRANGDLKYAYPKTLRPVDSRVHGPAE